MITEMNRQLRINFFFQSPLSYHADGYWPTLLTRKQKLYHTVPNLEVVAPTPFFRSVLRSNVPNVPMHMRHRQSFVRGRNLENI